MLLQTCYVGHVESQGILIIVLLLSHTQDGCCYNTCDELNDSGMKVLQRENELV